MDEKIVIRCDNCHNEYVTDSKYEVNICPICLDETYLKDAVRYPVTGEAAAWLLKADEALFINFDFDLALKYYKKAINLENNQPYAYLGAALAEFKVEFGFSGDPKVRRNGTKRFEESELFILACEHADDRRKTLYKSLAVKIDALLNKFDFEDAKKQGFTFEGTHLDGYSGEAEKIEIPYGVTHIDFLALFFAKNLKSVFIPSTVEFIDTQVFKSTVEHIAVDKGNEYFEVFGNNCLVEKKSKKLIFAGNGADIPADGKVEIIAKFAMQYRNDIKTLEIPNGVKTVEGNAFDCCSNIKRVGIPASVTKIKGAAFVNCDYVEEFYVDKNNGAYYVEGGCLIEREGMKLIRACVGCTIPEGVKEIGTAAFGAGHKRFAIPASMTGELGDAFCGSKDLEELFVAADNERYYCVNNCILERKTGTLAKGCINSVIPTDGSVSAIGKSAFSHSQMTCITVPQGVRRIETFAFDGCSKLREITLPNSLTDIGGYAFDFCKELKHIDLPSDLRYIGSGAFGYCPIKEIVIPASVREISEGAFVSCDALKSVIFDDAENWTVNEEPVDPEDLSGESAIDIITGFRALVKADRS